MTNRQLILLSLAITLATSVLFVATAAQDFAR